MISQFLKTLLRSSATHAGFAAALVCTLGTTEAGAHKLGFDALGNELDHPLEPITESQSSDDVVLAQNVDEDGDEFFNEDGDEFMNEDGDEFFNEDGDEFANEDGDGYDNSQGQGLSAEQRQRLDAVLENQVRVIEKTILWRDPLGPGYY